MMDMKKYSKYTIMFIIAFCSLLSLFSSISYAGSSDEGYKDGYSEGWLWGIEEAEDDMAEGNRKSYSKAIPSDDEIIEEYDLESETIIYKDFFLDGFKDGFKEGYNKTYTTSKDKDDEDDDEKYSANYAESLGYTMGEAYGYRDFYNGKSNRWTKAVPSSSSIVETFDLKKETNKYRSDFIDVFKTKFEEGYEDGYRKAKFTPFEASFEQGNIDGEYFGELLGDIFGKQDYYLGKSSNWERSIPSRNRIINDFSLNRDTEEYLDAFISSFNYSFELMYNEAYRSSNSMVNSIMYENGYKNGREAGLKRGEGFGKMDVILGQPNNVNRYKSYEYGVINEYRLNLETEEYQKGFISGYNEGLTEGYIKSYQELSYDSLLTKLVTEIIPISGGEITTQDKKISVKVDKGTYYNDVAISIDGLPDTYNWQLSLKNKFIKASDIYTINVSNSSYQFDNDKPLELSFEYYGPHNGGIYKFINNSWIYLPSKISEGRITTFIKPNSLNTSNGMYAVFIDKGVKNIRDIRGHWAKDEINTYARRGLLGLYADYSFKPDIPITRGQFLVLLSRVYNWNLNSLEENIKELENLEDYQSLGNYKNVVAYAIKNGYIDIYPDNKFNVYNTVTYNEINKIMKKVTKDSNFNWINTAYYMMSYKDTRSKSYNSMDNSVTRAEALYMLYLINEWKY